MYYQDNNVIYITISIIPLAIGYFMIGGMLEYVRVNRSLKGLRLAIIITVGLILLSGYQFAIYQLK